MALLDPVYRRGCAVLFVKKKDGASLVINYRELNVLRFLTAILSRESRLRHHYDPSKVKQSPNAETYYGDGSEKLSALCWLLPTFCEGFSQISFTSYPADEKDRGDGGTSDRLMTLTSVQSGKAMSCPDALSRKSRMKACFDSIILRDLERLISKEAQRDGRFNQNVQGFETVLLVEWAIKQDVATICILMETCQQDQINIRGLVDVTALAIPMWKWDEISMDFDTCFAYYTKRHDAIMGGANVSDKIRKFTSRFERISEGWGTRLKFSTSISSSKPMVSREDLSDFRNMLSCAFRMDGKCRAPICWDEVGERLIEGPELIEITNEKVAVAKEKLKEARSRQKSYADKHRRDLEFQVGDRVFLKVSPFRGVKRFGIKGKLSPRFIGPFEILERIGEVSYRLALPPQFSLSEEPESILDRQERVTRNKVIPFVKILWKNHPEREATWETEESMRASYPYFFV
ncbi:retrotransposon protein, putative, ty3-gypsy subclass [Tanacetum coccineum]